MTSLRSCASRGLAPLFVILALVGSAWAQASAPLTTPAPPVDGASGAVPVAGVLMLMLALLLVVAIAVKLYDMKRRREDEAVAMQARISEALLAEPSLSSLPITPTVHVPLGRRSPIRVEIAGAAPTPELREAALRLVIGEMARTRPDFRLEDRTVVVPSMFRRAA